MSAAGNSAAEEPWDGLGVEHKSEAGALQEASPVPATQPDPPILILVKPKVLEAIRRFEARRRQAPPPAPVGDGPADLDEAAPVDKCQETGPVYVSLSSFENKSRSKAAAAKMDSGVEMALVARQEARHRLQRAFAAAYHVAADEGQQGRRPVQLPAEVRNGRRCATLLHMDDPECDAVAPHSRACVLALVELGVPVRPRAAAAAADGKRESTTAAFHRKPFAVVSSLDEPGRRWRGAHRWLFNPAAHACRGMRSLVSPAQGATWNVFSDGAPTKGQEEDDDEDATDVPVSCVYKPLGRGFRNPSWSGEPEAEAVRDHLLALARHPHDAPPLAAYRNPKAVERLLLKPLAVRHRHLSALFPNAATMMLAKRCWDRRDYESVVLEHKLFRLETVCRPPLRSPGCPAVFACQWTDLAELEVFWHELSEEAVALYGASKNAGQPRGRVKATADDNNSKSTRKRNRAAAASEQDDNVDEESESSDGDAQEPTQDS